MVVLAWIPFKVHTNDFSLESLIALDMRNSNLEHAWKGIKFLKLLKILNLSHSHGLASTPNFMGLPNLENLILKDCIHLVEVHESIGELGRLTSLNLKGCENLKMLPRNICHLSSLEELILSGCSKLDGLPGELGKMKSLTVFHADGISMNKILTTTNEVKPWNFIFSSWIPNRRKSTECCCFSLASLPSSLVNLSLSNCNLSNDDLLQSVGRLSCLQQLNLSMNPISSLPETFKDLSSLRSLKVYDCLRLQSLPELPMSLAHLDMRRCRSLEMVANLPNLLRSLNLNSFGCEKLVEVHGMFKLGPIGNADAEMLSKLGLVDLQSVGSLKVELMNYQTKTRKKVPLQGLYECGIYSIFLPRSEVPSCCSNKRMGSSILFTVPKLSNLTIIAFNVYIIYSYAKNVDEPGWEVDFIKIRNKTKGLKWAYSPTFLGVPDDYKYVLWFSHWKMGHWLLEGGDKIYVEAKFEETFKAKEIGIQIVCDEHKEEGGQHSVHTTLSQNVVNSGDFSPYNISPGSYFLCHHIYDGHSGYHEDVDLAELAEIWFGDYEEGLTDDE